MISRPQCYHCATHRHIDGGSSAAIIFQLKCLLTLFCLYAVALHPMAHVQDKTAIPTTKHTVPVHYSKHITGKFWLSWTATGIMWLIFLFPRYSTIFLTPWHWMILIPWPTLVVVIQINYYHFFRWLKNPEKDTFLTTSCQQQALLVPHIVDV